MQRARLPVVLLIAVAALLSACERPDASHTTSPSALALLGTTTGNVAFDPPEAPPAPVSAPPGWAVDLELAIFSELENGTRSMRVVLQLTTLRGMGMEVWLRDQSGTVARWSGGSTRKYNGVVCFQMALEDRDSGERLAFAAGGHTAIVAFRDVERGIIAARELTVTGRPPGADGTRPAAASTVFRELLGCPRGS